MDGREWVEYTLRQDYLHLAALHKVTLEIHRTIIVSEA